jgi:hypothetical protein
LTSPRATLDDEEAGEGALVTDVASGIADPGAEPLETTTDDAGHFLLEGVPAGDHVLAVRGGGFSRSFPVHVDEGETTRVDVADRCQPGAADAGAMEGTFCGNTGALLAGAVVTVTFPDGETLHDLTDVDGSVFIGGLEPATYRVDVDHPTGAFTDPAVVVRAGETTSIDDIASCGERPPVGRIEGTACGVDHIGRLNGVVDLMVDDEVVVSTTTDAGGGFVFEQVAIGTYHLRLVAGGATRDIPNVVVTSLSTTRVDESAMCQQEPEIPTDPTPPPSEPPPSEPPPVDTTTPPPPPPAEPPPRICQDTGASASAGAWKKFLDTTLLCFGDDLDRNPAEFLYAHIPAETSGVWSNHDILNINFSQDSTIDEGLRGGERLRLRHDGERRGRQHVAAARDRLELAAVDPQRAAAEAEIDGAPAQHERRHLHPTLRARHALAAVQRRELPQLLDGVLQLLEEALHAHFGDEAPAAARTRRRERSALEQLDVDAARALHQRTPPARPRQTSMDRKRSRSSFGARTTSRAPSSSQSSFTTRALSRMGPRTFCRP